MSRFPATTTRTRQPNLSTRFKEAFETLQLDSWTQVLSNGDIIQVDGNAVASSYLVISKDPIAVGISTLETKSLFRMPYEATLGVHMSQRTIGQEFAIDFISDEDPIEAPADLQIASITQATTTLTVNTTLPHNLKPGMRIGIRDCVDPRFNYPVLVVATAPTPIQFTVTAGAMGALPSVTAGPFTSGFVYLRSSLGFARNGTSMIFENAVATNASFYLRSESGDVLPSGTATGNHAVSIGTSASIQAINAALAYTFQPTNEFRVKAFSGGIQWSDIPVDSVAAETNRHKRTQVVPDINHNYKLRFRCINHPSLSRPIAQIVTAVKTGTTTATVTTDVPHGLTTADLVTLHGARDVTNYPNVVTATAVASIVNATQFTIVWGGAVTATTFGGFVSRVNGGQVIQAVSGQNIQSISRTSNIITAVGSAAWAGLLIGDYINLVSVRNAVDGALIAGLDGAYRVRDIQTTSLFLEPIGNTATGNDIVSTNCGGAVIKRTDLRISFARVIDFDRQRVEFLPRPQGDVSEALSVNIQNTPAVTLSSGTVTTVTTVTTVNTLSALTGGGVPEDAAATANPVVTGGVVRTARAPVTLIAGDAARHTITTEGSMTVTPGPVVPLIEVASAARTTTGNSGLISVPTGGGLSGLIAVSAASGTTPTLDVALEESYDNGTTWTQVWAAPRLTGISTAVIPPMLTAGLRRWAWTVAGTTPSFTFAITVNAVPNVDSLVRQSFDRTAGLLTGTLNATSASVPVTGCRLITAKVSLGAVTTTPGTYQIQISDDNVNWSNVGTATLSVANQTTAFFMPAGFTANWARVICTSAATGQTGNFVAINAIS